MEIFGVVLDTWQVWALLGILFFIIEIFTPAFVSACLGIGFLTGSLASALGMSYTWQLIFFSVGTALSFFLVRPFVMKIGYKGVENMKTNADSLVGKVGKVIEAIDDSKGTGYVAVDGDQWKAVSIDGTCIEIGTKVEITARESIVVTVKKA
ncbi:MAG: NfeD family protein [Bacteroidetes bacterium]|jgi:membrane protein implicated in regulation of membrane protease activity|nr:NfeD family protein [Bacteroidota bacterium]